MLKILCTWPHPVSWTNLQYRRSHHPQCTTAFYLSGTWHILLTLTLELQLLFFLEKFYSCFKMQLPCRPFHRSLLASYFLGRSVPWVPRAPSYLHSGTFICNCYFRFMHLLPLLECEFWVCTFHFCVSGIESGFLTLNE